MQIDQTKFMNAIIERTNQKLNQFHNQIIVLETQLQFAIEANQELTNELEKIKKRQKSD